MRRRGSNLALENAVANHGIEQHQRKHKDEPADGMLDAKSLSTIKTPNRKMFVGDPKPDVKNLECMNRC
jgi:hypothetical protein